MNRSRLVLAAAALTLLLAATPAAAIGPADRDPQNAAGAHASWLSVLPDWVLGLLGERAPAVRRTVAANEAPTAHAPPPQNGGEPPSNSEGDYGPSWDPGG